MELREEVGAKESFRRKLVKNRLKWAEHVEQMEEEWLMKRADDWWDWEGWDWEGNGE